MYHFPHAPSDEYASKTKMLAKPPRRELCSKTEYAMGKETTDYLLDPKPNPVDVVVEGQSHFFQTDNEKESTTKKKRKRKTIIQSLEKRLIYLEKFFDENDPDCLSNKITKGVITLKELQAELYRVQPSRTVDFYKTSKKDFCHSLLEIR